MKVRSAGFKLKTRLPIHFRLLQVIQLTFSIAKEW